MDHDESLAGRVIAVPETRHLDVLASLIEKRGATVLRCPLVSIEDAADAGPIVKWIDRVIDTPPAVLVFYTGEGVVRLTGFAERSGRKERFVAALSTTTTITRGPKPKRALRSLGLEPSIEAAEPTTEGVIAALEQVDLTGGRVAVQLYGSEPNEKLLRFLETRRIEYDFVAPYTYASEAHEDSVADLIARMQHSQIDAIAFTSKSQFDRLRAVARKRGLEEALERGLHATRVAAVGPVVAEELTAAGVRVDAMPPENFHMKPLVNVLAALFER